MLTLRDFDVLDIRFPTSESLAGSDAMHAAPDYSAAYVILRTNQPGLEGHGLTFTLGRGTELCVAAAKYFCNKLAGVSLESITSDFAAFWQSLVADDQLRWVGPEKGVIHLATAAVINAIWDLWAKAAGKPLWKLLADMPAEQLISTIDFSYLAEVLTPAEAITILKANDSTRADREAELCRTGFPAYTTSTGWLGYSDEKITHLVREGLAAGWNHFKIKVGVNLEDDRRRAALVRREIGPTRKLMVDANQRWDVREAIANIRALAEFDPWWVEEPTSPDDVVGHAEIAKAVAPIRIATGEMCQNRITFKQLMQLDAIRFCQLDSCRLGGVNECLAVMLLAKRFGIPVCPHAGGVGLCEYVNHLIMVDYIRIGASLENRVAEYVDHLHEHFEHPAVIQNAHYMPPTAPGYGATMHADSLREFQFPDGSMWRRTMVI
ncbi:MAG: enolase C-terminal domain-like protein [Pirellulales bacterium]